MATEIDKFLFIMSLAKRRFGARRVHWEAERKFKTKMDMGEVEWIVNGYRNGRAAARSRSDSSSRAREMAVDSDYAMMMEYGSRKLLEALLREKQKDGKAI